MLQSHHDFAAAFNRQRNLFTQHLRQGEAAVLQAVAAQRAAQRGAVRKAEEEARRSMIKQHWQDQSGMHDRTSRSAMVDVEGVILKVVHKGPYVKRETYVKLMIDLDDIVTFLYSTRLAA